MSGSLPHAGSLKVPWGIAIAPAGLWSLQGDGRFDPDAGWLLCPPQRILKSVSRCPRACAGHRGEDQELYELPPSAESSAAIAPTR